MMLEIDARGEKKNQVNSRVTLAKLHSGWRSVVIGLKNDYTEKERKREGESKKW